MSSLLMFCNVVELEGKPNLLRIVRTVSALTAKLRPPDHHPQKVVNSKSV